MSPRFACFWAMVLACTAVHGQEIRTIGDDIRDNVANLLRVQQQGVKVRGQYNQTLAAARERFFTTALGTAAHKRADTEFADLLAGKDMNYLGLCLNEGVYKGLRFSKAIGILAGGSLTAGDNEFIDGGVRSGAMNEFTAWVNGVRASLGARTPDQSLFVTDSDALKRALIANEPLYAKYKAVRDEIEINSWRMAHDSSLPKLGKLPLEEHKVVQIFDATLNPGGLDTGLPDSLVEELNVARKAGQTMLYCRYGPNYESSGLKSYREAVYWYRSRSPEIHHSFMSVGSPREECPATDGEVLDGGKYLPDLRFAPTYREEQKEKATKMQREAEEQARRQLQQTTNPGGQSAVAPHAETKAANSPPLAPSASVRVPSRSTAEDRAEATRRRQCEIVSGAIARTREQGGRSGRMNEQYLQNLQSRFAALRCASE